MDRTKPSLEELLGSHFGLDEEQAFNAALELIAEDLPGWVKDPFDFRFVSQIEKYAARGPHSLHKNEEFRKLIEQNQIIRLELFFRGNRSKSYRLGAGTDVTVYIQEKFKRKSEYYEASGRFYIVVFPEESK